MLPPVDPGTLQRNPNFELLYKDLTTRKLNPDGSTRDTKKQRMHDEIRRVRASRYFLKTHAILTLSHGYCKEASLSPQELFFTSLPPASSQVSKIFAFYDR
jgi:hypothetical protein